MLRSPRSGKRGRPGASNKASSLNQLDRDEFAAAGAREPMFNAPAVVVTLCAVLIGLYVLQRLFLDDAGLGRLALTRDAVVQGHWETLLTSQFLHGSWPHVLLNSVGLFAFAPSRRPR